MATTTANQSLPVPEASDPVDVPSDFNALAQAVEKLVIMRFDDAGDRDSKVSSPEDGMVCCLLDTNSFQVYADGAWKTFFRGDAPGSSVAHGHISSYQSTPPSDAPLGALAIDRDDQRGWTKDLSGVWRPMAAAAVIADTTYRYSGSGFETAEGANSNFCSMTVNTTAASTKLHIKGIGLYSLLGVGVYGGIYGGWQDVAIVIKVTPPGGSATELKRWTNREMNTGGTGSTTVGGPTPRTATAQLTYTAVATGAYYFELQMIVGTGGQGNVANLGGDMTIQPVVVSTTF